MRNRPRFILAFALLVELALALFPPMRFERMDQELGVTVGMTEHHFLLWGMAGAWTVDGDRFVVYAVLIALAAGIALLVESWIHSASASR